MTYQTLKIEVGSIVSGLIPNESVEITKIQALGSKYSLSYTGVNSHRAGSKIMTLEQIDTLEILTAEGEFNFKGDPERFVLYAEAERIKSAYQFDPLFAINCSVVDPLPHQVEAYGDEGDGYEVLEEKERPCPSLAQPSYDCYKRQYKYD